MIMDLCIFLCSSALFSTFFQCVFFINVELYLYPTMIGSFSERIQYSIMIDTPVMIDLLCNFLQFTLYLCYFHQVNHLIVFPEVGSWLPLPALLIKHTRLDSYFKTRRQLFSLPTHCFYHRHSELPPLSAPPCHEMRPPGYFFSSSVPPLLLPTVRPLKHVYPLPLPTTSLN